MIKKIILFILLISNLLVADTLVIDTEKFVFEEFKMSQFIDSSNNLSIKDVVKIDFNASVPNAYSLGIKLNKYIWHKFSVTNSLSKNIDFIFNDSFYFFPAIYDMYVVDTKGKVVNSYFGGFDRNDSKQNDLGHILSFVHIYLDANETYTFYTKTYFKNGNSGIYDYSIFDIDSHIISMMFENTLSAFLLGGMLILILYNFILSIYTKDKTYLYYVAYLFSTFVIGFVYTSGFANKFFDIANTPWIYYAVYSSPLTSMFILLFTSKIFEMKKFYPILNRFVIASSYFFGSYIVLSMIFGLLEYFEIMLGFSLLSGFGIVFIGIYMSYTKNRLGFIYLVSTTLYAIFAVITILYYQGIVPTNMFTANSIMIGSLIEGLGLSLLLAYRINILKNQNSSLEILSSTDAMTKLYNRRYFLEMSESIINLSKRNKTDVCVIMIDIDKFKNINDTYGHGVGDEVIILFSSTLKELSRDSDIVCRWGGEEFILLLPSTGIEGALNIAEKIRLEVEKLSVPLNDDKKLSFTASIGVSLVHNKEDKTILNSIDRADKALYEAKESGRNKVCYNN